MDKIGLVGSPSTTSKITVDIVEDAVSDALLGQLVSLPHKVTDGHVIAIGTVSEIETRNRWHEDPNMRGVLKQHGQLPHLSAVGDVRTAIVHVQATYHSITEQPSVDNSPTESGATFPMSPTTGASVHRVTDSFLTNLLRRHKEKIVFLGNTYNMEDVRLPLTIRHFGPVEKGGAGEAYHSGIFGMTGSGKSVFAAYVLAAQLQHSDLAIIIMDPQGQFTSGEGLPVPLGQWAQEHGRTVLKYSISGDLRLPQDASMLMGLLGNTRFFKDILTIKRAENRETAEAEFERILKDQTEWNSEESASLLRTILNKLVSDDQAMTRIYSSSGPRDRLELSIHRILNESTNWNLAFDLFRPIHSLFMKGEKRTSILKVLEDTFNPETKPRPFVILDFSSTATSEVDALIDSTPVKAHILRIVCRHLNRLAEKAYRKRSMLNTLVVFDEAQRFAADNPEDDESKELAEKLVDYVRTTRKYGLGWMFITQEVGALRRGIYNQLRFRAFGYGLTSGSELQRLKETIGDQAPLDLYRSFVDPAAATPPRYPFMLQGPISPLSFTGAPLFLSVYTHFGQFKDDNSL